VAFITILDLYDHSDTTKCHQGIMPAFCMDRRG
jgi:hypothetical protein